MSAAVLDQRRIGRAALATSAFMMAHQVAGKAARDAIFLSHFRTSDLPAMVAVAAIVAVAISVVRSRSLVRFGPYRITALSFALSGVLQIAEWLLLGYQPRVAACIIYLHIVAFGAVLLSGFWSLMNESFEPLSAKSAFGRISGMGTLGGLSGGLLAERVTAWFSPADVVVLLAILHLACAGFLWRAFPFGTAAKIKTAPRAAPTRDTRIIDALQRYPFLLSLAGLVVMASAGTALLDFVFKFQAAHAIGRGAPLLRYFALYYTACSLLTFLIQTFLTRFIVQHAGLAVCSGALPAAVTFGSLTALFVPGFKLLSGVRALEIVTRGSVYRSAYELFYTAVAPSDKRAVKSVIDVGADRAGDAVGAAGTSLLLVLAPGSYGPILAAAAVVSVIATLLAARLQQGYLNALEKSLVDRAIELDPSMTEDSATRSILMRSMTMPFRGLAVGAPEERVTPPPPVHGDPFLSRAGDLRSGDLARVTKAASQLGPKDWTLAPLLIDLLAWDEALPAARQALERIGFKVTGMLVDALLDSESDFAVRRRVPRVLALLPSKWAIEGLFAGLEDQRFEVRFYSARALYLVLKDHADLMVAPERVWIAVNRELSLHRSVSDSHRLLDSRVSNEKEWFFDDDELLDRADRNLEHLFTLLAILLPGDAVRIAFRAVHSEDRQLKGTAFEYLESATPAATRRLLLPFLEADSKNRLRSGSPGEQDQALRNLLSTNVQVNENLKLRPFRVEARN